VKLFAFQPPHHGPHSFYVMAEDEAAARAAVDAHIAAQLDQVEGPWLVGLSSRDIEGWPQDFSMQAMEAGEVITQEND